MTFYKMLYLCHIYKDDLSERTEGNSRRGQKGYSVAYTLKITMIQQG